MEIKEAIRSAFKEWVLPELERLHEDNIQIKSILELTNKRLDDVNLHLADQSRRIDETNKRIDAVRTELSQQITDVRTELCQKITDVRTEMTHCMDDTSRRFDEINKRFDSTNDRIDRVRTELNQRMDKISQEMVNQRERENLVERIQHLEYRCTNMEHRLAV